MNNELERIFMSEPVDHEGSARCVLAMYPGVYKYTLTHGWLVYNGKFWEADGGASVGRAIVETLRSREKLVDAKVEDDKVANFLKKSLACNNWVVNGIRSRLQEQKEVHCSIDDFDKFPDKINCNNGLVDLRTGEIVPHDSSQLFTYC